MTGSTSYPQESSPQYAFAKIARLFAQKESNATHEKQYPQEQHDASFPHMKSIILMNGLE
jgi:hypothetical protein